MEKLLEDDRKIIFLEELENNDKGIYSMINMGEYIGYKKGKFGEEAPDDWKLLFYDIYNDKEEKVLSIEALCDDNGDYSKFIEKTDDYKRIVIINSNTVVRDYAYVGNKEELYYTTNNFLGYRLDQYFDINPEMKEKNAMLKNFVEQAEELKKEIESNKRR